MGNLCERKFNILDVCGINFLEWKIDGFKYLRTEGLEHTIEEGNNATLEERVRVLLFLRCHIHESLKSNYLMVKDPRELWTNLEEHFRNIGMVIKCKASHEWSDLRFQDFKSIDEYDSAIHRITRQLRLCGELVTDHQMLEKTISTMYTDNIIMQMHYRKMGFSRYSDLASDKLLLRNHYNRSMSTEAPSLKANAPQKGGHGSEHGYGNVYHKAKYFKGMGKGKRYQPRCNKKYLARPKGECHKCGIIGHYGKECGTLKYSVDQYSKNNGQKEEA